MTKRWSSTRSDLTKTKRQASKEARRYNPEIVKQILEADAAPNEAVVSNADELFDYLDSD